MARSQVCAQENLKQRALTQEGVQMKGQHPGKLWESNFTKIWLAKEGYMSLFVNIDTFSRWLKEFSNQSETAQIVASKPIPETVTPICSSP